MFRRRYPGLPMLLPSTDSTAAVAQFDSSVQINRDADQSTIGEN